LKVQTNVQKNIFHKIKKNRESFTITLKATKNVFSVKETCPLSIEKGKKKTKLSKHSTNCSCTAKARTQSHNTQKKQTNKQNINRMEKEIKKKLRIFLVRL